MDSDPMLTESHSSSESLDVESSNKSQDLSNELDLSVPVNPFGVPFQEKQSLVQAVQDFGTSQGFVLTIKRSRERSVIFHCNWAGPYRHSKKYHPKQIQKTGSKKCGCLYKVEAFLIGYLIGGLLDLRTVNIITNWIQWLATLSIGIKLWHRRFAKTLNKYIWQASMQDRLLQAYSQNTSMFLLQNVMFIMWKGECVLRVKWVCLESKHW